MKTISLQIGNSDHKLSQLQWSQFVEQMDHIVTHYALAIHFAGGPPNSKPWQNFAWVFECDDGNIPALKNSLMLMRRSFKQDSVGYLEGKTEFL